MKEKPYLILTFLFLGISSVFAQKTYQPTRESIDSRSAAPLKDDFAGASTVENAACNWTGALWLQGNDNYPYQLFRREFEIKKVPEKVLFHIYANEFYRLHINGRYVGDGPRRGIPSVYRSYRVDNLLHAGSNVISVETYIRTEYGKGFYMSVGEAQIACVLEDVEGKITMLRSEAGGWTNAPGTAWMEKAARSTGWSPSEIYDIRKEQIGWRLQGFKGSGWKPAWALLGEAINPDDFEADPAKPVARSFLPASRLVSINDAISKTNPEPCNNIFKYLTEERWEDMTSSKIRAVEALLDPRKGSVIVDRFSQDSDTARRSPTVTLDFGRQINGNFYIDAEGNDGAIIDIGYAEALFDGRVTNHKLTAEWAGGYHADRAILRSGRQTWESFHWEGIRYVQLTFRIRSQPLIIHRFGVIERDPPLPNRGRFLCSDPEVNELWAGTERTLRATTQDMFMDNVFREKGAWQGDGITSAIRTCCVLTGNIPILRHNIRQFTFHPEENRFFLKRAGERALKPLMDSGEDRLCNRYFLHPMQTFNTLLNDYRFFVTSQDIQEDGVLAASRAYADYLKQYLNSRGLIENHPGIPWVDGPLTIKTGAGEVAHSNLLYLLFLRGLANAETAVGNHIDSEENWKHANAIADALYADFWDKNRGLYAGIVINGTQVEGKFSEHANALALIAGLGKNGRDVTILKNLIEGANDIEKTDPLFIHYLIAALYQFDQNAIALDIMRKRYDFMLNLHPNATFWEVSNDPKGQAVAQNGSSAPAFLLSTEVLGIKPTQPGFSEFNVEPKPSGLAWAEGSMPCPQGDIQVRWEISGKKFILTVDVPKGTRASVYMPLAVSYLLNSNKFDGGRLARQRYIIPLAPGRHRVESIGMQE